MSEETRKAGDRTVVTMDPTADVVDKLRATQVVPVVTFHDPTQVDAVIGGLVEGGVRAIEVTLRTPHGLPAIRRIAERGDLVVGAGTVLDAGLVTEVADAGAEFVVSPGLDEGVVAATQDRGLLALPGVATASEVQRARSLGLRHVKLFPAGLLGGIALVEALHHPFPDMSFMPSGGVSLETAPDYLIHRAVFAVGGSWLIPSGSHDRSSSALRIDVRARAGETVTALARVHRRD